MDRRYITKLDTVENMKKFGATEKNVPKGVLASDYPGESFAYVAFIPIFCEGVAFSSTKISYMEEVFGLTDLHDGMIIYIINLDNPYEVEYARYVEQFYNEAIDIYGNISDYFNENSARDVQAIVYHIDKIENYINEKCESNIELRELYGLSKRRNIS